MLCGGIIQVMESNQRRIFEWQTSLGNTSEEHSRTNPQQEDWGRSVAIVKQYVHSELQNILNIEQI
jgi:hypothetical protein